MTAQNPPRDVTQGKEVAVTAPEVVDPISNVITATIWVILPEIALSQSARGMIEGRDVGPGPGQGPGQGPPGVSQGPNLIHAIDAVVREIPRRKDVGALPQDLGQAVGQEALALKVGRTEVRKKGQGVPAQRVGPRMSKRIGRDHQASQSKEWKLIT